MKKITFTFVAIICMIFIAGAQNFSTIPDMGTSTSVLAKYPFNMSSGYTRTAVIYNKADIGGGGTIYKIAVITNTACAETSIPIVVKFKYSTSASWGGTGTYAALSTGATTVYSGGYHFDAGINYITLQTPFTFSFNVNHLIVFFECNYGGTGSTAPIDFVCKPVDSSVDYTTLFGNSNGSAPTTNGQLIDYQPVVSLYFNAPDKPFSLASEAACTGNNISWQKNAANDMVIVIGKLGSAVINGPQCFGNYAAGDSLGFGSVVIYSGSLQTATMHTTVLPGQMYYYRAWSFNTSKIFSELDKTTSLLSAYNAPYTNDFDGGSGLPAGWVGSLTVVPDHGVADQGLVAELQPPNVEKSVSSPVICNIITNSVLEFDYRIVNISGYPNTATPTSQIDTIYVQISTDNGHTYSDIYYITPDNHTASTSFSTVQIPLTAYAEEGINVNFRCTRGSGSYFVDIDNFKIDNITGIENKTENNFQIYPNPSNGELFIVKPNDISSEYKCAIYNTCGINCRTTTLSTNNTSKIDINRLLPGIYLLEITNGNITYHSKFVKY